MKALKLKVCGMRDPANIQGVLQSRPDYIGYIFHPKSKRYVGEKPNPEIFKQVPETTKKVAVFVNEKPGKVIALCQQFGIEVVQLHGQESPDYCQTVRNTGLVVFKAFAIEEQFDFSILKKYEGTVDYFLFDTKGKLPGGTGLKFNWEILKQYEVKVPFFLSGGIGPDDVEAVLAFDHDQLYALDINSGFEIEPALKNIERVQEFISQIRKNK
ncbi:MAG TPA: phosphoribosylanthranilate isomerase [Sunxiuqinia sp.]|nr:phosphoribosylanthranilate isomerase [Sunxiuqinia sp.]